MLFHAHAADGDGELVRAELRELMRDMIGEGHEITEEDVNTLIRRADKAKDGALHNLEIVRALEMWEQEVEQRKLSAAMLYLRPEATVWGCTQKHT